MRPLQMFYYFALFLFICNTTAIKKKVTNTNLSSEKSVSDSDTLHSFPMFEIESKETVGDTAYFSFALKKYPLNNDTLSIWVTAKVNTKIDSSIILTLKGCGKRGIYFGTTEEQAMKNSKDMTAVLRHYRYEIEKDIMIQKF